MTAAEARNKAIEVHTNSDNSQYATIKEMIAVAVGKGDFECSVYNVPISGLVQNKLEDEGYVVSYKMDRNESYSLIKW